MRTLSFGSVLPNNPQDFQRFVIDALHQIEQASAEDVEAAIGELTIAGAYTATRTLTPGTATLAQLAAFVATMVSDIKQKGQKRGYGS